jgi:DNA repair exonuclease SbcCD nuclease subunit
MLHSHPTRIALAKPLTSFRFLHAADLHLGSPLRGLALRDAEVARRFADATRNAFVHLVDSALAERVDFVVIAGDVYDGAWRDNAIGLFFNRLVARLDRAGIPVYLSRGNHDAESVVTRSVALPASVHQFPTDRPGTFDIAHLRVALHGQGFAERSARANLALGYPGRRPGWFNIGVLHTSLDGRPPHADYAPCALDDLMSRGYDYWALGHVHDFEVVARDPAPVVYPGNLQGRSVREPGPKGAVIVTVTDGRVVDVARTIHDQARWAAASIDLTGTEDRTAVRPLAERALEGLTAAAEGRLLALRLTLTGRTPLRPWIVASRTMLFDELQAICHHLDADIWLEKLGLQLDTPERADAPIVAGGMDLRSLLTAAATDSAVDVRIEQLAQEIGVRLPSGLGAEGVGLFGEPASLLAEAADLLLERVGREG